MQKQLPISPRTKQYRKDGLRSIPFSARKLPKVGHMPLMCVCGGASCSNMIMSGPVLLLENIAGLRVERVVAVQSVSIISDQIFRRLEKAVH